MSEADEKNVPIASVVMSACATDQRFLEESISSVLNQTEQHFEFILVDDGLSEENRQYLSSITDSRLHILVNPKNLGQSRSVNRALRVARGKYVVRMDADDVMTPDRIRVEVAFMEAHPDVVAASARASRTSDSRVVPRLYPDSNSLKIGLLFTCDMVHPTMIIRSEVIRQSDLHYDENQLYSQDYMFWVEALDRGKVAQINEVVLKYRVHAGQITSSKTQEQLACARRARELLWARFGLRLSEEDGNMLAVLANGVVGGRSKELDRFLGDVRDDASQRMSREDFDLFRRELSFRVLKAAARTLSSGGFRDVACWKGFWKCAANIRWWPFYVSALCA